MNASSNTAKRTVAGLSAMGLLSSTTLQVLLASSSATAIMVAMPRRVSAAECITGVSPTFANVVNSVNTTKTAGLTAVTAQTAQAVTGVNTTATTANALTGATLATSTGQGVTLENPQLVNAITAKADTA